MTAIINITYNGQNGDYRVDMHPSMDDHAIRAMCEEAIRNGEVSGIKARDIRYGAFQNFVVDRFTARNGEPARFVLRPKVPFGRGVVTAARGV